MSTLLPWQNEKKTKYRSTKVDTAGGVFDSRKEYERWIELCTMQNIGAISDLKRQVPFELIPQFECKGKRFRRTVYVADFTYYQDGEYVVEDVKGYKKGAAYQIYMMKAKLLAEKYGILVKET